MSNSPMTAERPRPVVLCILDGWGEREGGDDNAIFHATTPNWDRYSATCPKSQLLASAGEVGLPDGQMGNSEVGHMNLGAGRAVLQDLPLIDHAVEDGSLATNKALASLIDALTKSGGICHLMGLLSPGGVHSHQNHLVALARAVATQGIDVNIHGFLDGRDTPPQSAKEFATTLIDDLDGIAGVQLVTLGGRYYAMDRDQRWDRNALAYAALVDGIGEVAAEPVAAIDRGYAAGQTDEFLLPTVIGGYTGMNDGDAILMGNFRADRVRQILAALLDPAFHGFERNRSIDFCAAVGLTEYSTALNEFLSTMFPRRSLDQILGSVVAEADMTQLRIAETEKYAHVTFFFNGGEESAFPGEERILVPSPKVATYDLQPEMSAREVTTRLTDKIEANKFDLVVVNFANGDMVGHTGNFDAAVAATEIVDVCLGQIEASIQNVGGCLLITADHGNVERMHDYETAQPHTAHTMSPVPLILVNPPNYAGALSNGVLADVAPTVLQLLGLPQPAAMTGQSLILDLASKSKASRKHAPA